MIVSHHQDLDKTFAYRALLPICLHSIIHYTYS